MPTLAHRLRSAMDADCVTVTEMPALLREAASEIERLQRLAYRYPASRAADFEAVRIVRQRHSDVAMKNDFAGDALQAHLDRALLLAIIAFTSQRTSSLPSSPLCQSQAHPGTNGWVEEGERTENVQLEA